MARIRTVKPEFWTDSKTGTLSGIATKLFLGMLNHADDVGVLPFDVEELKAKILPYERGEARVIIEPPLLNELCRKGLVLMFWLTPDEGTLTIQRVLTESSMNTHGALSEESVNTHGALTEPSRSYLYIRNFLKHQCVNRP